MPKRTTLEVVQQIYLWESAAIRPPDRPDGLVEDPRWKAIPPSSSSPNFYIGLRGIVFHRGCHKAARPYDIGRGFDGLTRIFQLSCPPEGCDWFPVVPMTVPMPASGHLAYGAGNLHGCRMVNGRFDSFLLFNLAKFCGYKITDYRWRLHGICKNVLIGYAQNTKMMC